MLSGDDAFVSNPAQAQLYSYIADDARRVWNDEGDLWAFVTDVPGVDDYYDFPIGSPLSVSGPLREGAEGHRHRARARRQRADGGGQGLPGAAEQRHLAARPERRRHRRPAVGARALGRHAGDSRVFQFTRVEDIAYDKRPGMQNVVYVVDSGRGATARRRQRVHVVERPHLEAGARPERPDQGAVVLDPDRGRRRPRQDARRRCTSRTTSSRPRRACSSRRIRARASSSRSAPPTPPRRRRGSGSTTSRPARTGRGEGQPVGRRRADWTWTRRRGATRAPGSRAASSTRRTSSATGAFLVDVQAGTLRDHRREARQHSPTSVTAASSGSCGSRARSA